MPFSFATDRTFQALHASVFRRADISSTPQVNIIITGASSDIGAELAHVDLHASEGGANLALINCTKGLHVLKINYKEIKVQCEKFWECSPQKVEICIYL